MTQPRVTVQILVDALNKMPRDLEVKQEGCDCYQFSGEVIEVNLRGGHWVLIQRTSNQKDW